MPTQKQSTRSPFYHLFVFLFSYLVATAMPNLALAQSQNQTSDFSTTLNVPISLSLRLDKSSLQINGSGTEFVSIKNTAFVSTNSANGYKLSLNSEDEETDLIHNITPSLKITNLPGATSQDNFPSKTWGYSLNNNNYLPIPKLSETSIMKETSNFSAIESAIDFYIGVKLDNDLLSGVYSKPLVITAIANPDPEPTFEGITTMQEMTHDICNNETTPHAFVGGASSGEILAATTRTHTADKNFIPESELTDTRDGKKYTIRKLADGNCWMVKNLDLGDTAVSLTPENTDLNGVSGFTLGPAETNANTSWGTYNNASAVNTLRLHDDGNKWMTNVSLSAQESVTSSEPSDPELKLKHIGNHYNWYAATAKTGTYEMTSNQEASSSICPKGWRLPSNNGSKNYLNLTQITYRLTINTSSGEGPNSSLKLRQKPFSLPLSGYRYYFGSVSNQGSYGWFWSSTANSSTDSYNLGLHYAHLNPQNANVKAVGFSIRCLAR